MSDWIEHYTPRSKYANVLFPHRALKGPTAETLRWWDALQAEGARPTGVFGVDAHATKVRRFGWEFEVYSYAHCFARLVNYLQLDEPLSDSFEEASRQVWEALRRGRVIMANRGQGDAAGSTFLAVRGAGDAGGYLRRRGAAGAGGDAGICLPATSRANADLQRGARGPCAQEPDAALRLSGGGALSRRGAPPRALDHDQPHPCSGLTDVLSCFNNSRLLSTIFQRLARWGSCQPFPACCPALPARRSGKLLQKIMRRMVRWFVLLLIGVVAAVGLLLVGMRLAAVSPRGGL